MTYVTRMCASLIVAATGFAGLAAAPAAAQTGLTIEYRDWDRDDARRWYDERDRRAHWRDDRRDWDRRDWDRRDRDRRDWRHYRDHHHGYAPRRCWTEWRWDRWRDQRVAVRYCR